MVKLLREVGSVVQLVKLLLEPLANPYWNASLVLAPLLPPELLANASWEVADDGSVVFGS